MIRRYIIDTYAWIEYFRGSMIGHKIMNIIENGGNITPTIVLAEMKRKFVEWRRVDFDEKLNFIRSKSDILPLDEETAILAGELRATIGIEGIGLVDCILLALAKIHEIKVLTGDEHFRGLEEAEFFENQGDKLDA